MSGGHVEIHSSSKIHTFVQRNVKYHLVLDVGKNKRNVFEPSCDPLTHVDGQNVRLSWYFYKECFYVLLYTLCAAIFEI